MMILIAGPYRSGTNDDPESMTRNLRRLEEVGQQQGPQIEITD